MEDTGFRVDANELSSEEIEPAEMFIENIMMCLWDGDADAQTKTPNTKDTMRAKNRACAQRSRASDREYTNLMLAELNSLAETLQMFATYIDELQLHGACAAGCMHGLELCSTQQFSIALIQKSETGSSAKALSGISTKERNRIHAQTSRCRKSHFLRDIVIERDASLSTVQELVQYTSTLESSCSLLSDFSLCDCGTMAAFLSCADIRQRLLQRMCTHTQECEHLKSPSAYRVMHRINFR